MSEDRARRPEPPRDHPIRAFSTLWTEAASRLATSTEGIDNTDDGAVQCIERGVRNAYSVIDRYISEGQRVAGELGRSYAEVGLGGEGGQEIQARWLQLSGELVSSWFDLIGLMSESLIPLRDGAEAHGSREAAPAGSPTETAPEVVFEVASGTPVRLSANITPGAQKFSLVASPARHQQDATSLLTFDVQTSHQSSTVVVRARIPGDAASGTYIGNVVNDHTGEILGSLTVEIL